MKKDKIKKAVVIGCIAVTCLFVGFVVGVGITETAMEQEYAKDMEELQAFREFREALNSWEDTEVEETTEAEQTPSETDDNATVSDIPQTWTEGMYKVGVDIPAGEYVLITDLSGHGYFSIDADSAGDSILNNDNFTTNAIVTVLDGQYLTLNRCTAYKMGEEPTLNTAAAGTFKVGVHIPAGEYKIHSDGSGYVEVGTSSAADYDIVTNDNFDGDSYITVSDGQYLKLNRAYIVQ